MNTVQPGTALPTPAAYTQTPLVDPAQLRPGVYITAALMSVLWEVLATPEGDTVRLQHGLKPRAEGHAHSLAFHQNTTCACGYRLQRLSSTDDIAGLLPLTGAASKAMVLTPTRPLVEVDPHMIYLTATGVSVRRLPMAGTLETHWQTLQYDTVNLPLLPVLHPLWGLPASVRAWMEGLAAEAR